MTDPNNDDDNNNASQVVPTLQQLAMQAVQQYNIDLNGYFQEVAAETEVYVTNLAAAHQNVVTDQAAVGELHTAFMQFVQHAADAPPEMGPDDAQAFVVELSEAARDLVARIQTQAHSVAAMLDFLRGHAADSAYTTMLSSYEYMAQQLAEWEELVSSILATTGSAVFS